MAAFGEAPFQCPVCGEDCRVVFSVTPQRSLTGVGQASEAGLTHLVVDVRPTTVTGCAHVQQMNED